MPVKKAHGAGRLSAAHNKAADTLFSSFMLWFISKKPMHGYEMISTLRKDHQSVHIGPAHIYPVLASLLKRGLIKVKKVAKGKRVRKLYTITSAGKSRLAQIKRTHFSNNLRARFLKEMTG